MMDYTTIIATKPGTPPPKVEKRTGDLKVLQLDCTPLLCENELVLNTVRVISPNLSITEIKPNFGKYIRFKAEGGPSTDIPYSDYLISFIIETTMGSELIIPLNIRVYSV